MEPPPRYRRRARRGVLYTLGGLLPASLGGPFKYGWCGLGAGVLCLRVDMRNLLHAAFLVNSMILAICFMVFDLEWRREVFNANTNCAWQSELLELFINSVAVYFVILTLVASTTFVMCVGRKSSVYKNAFYLLTLYSSATFILAIILSISYFIGSRIVADHCVNTSDIQMLELRMCLVSVVGIITNGIYMIVGMVQGTREIDENVANSVRVSVAYDNQIFRLSSSEFAMMPPPPPYTRNGSGPRRGAIIRPSTECSRPRRTAPLFQHENSISQKPAKPDGLGIGSDVNTGGIGSDATSGGTGSDVTPGGSESTGHSGSGVRSAQQSSATKVQGGLSPDEHHIQPQVV